MAHVFTLGNEKLVISDELAAYNELRQEFMPLANQAEEMFKELYLKYNHDFESMINNFPDHVMMSLNIVIDYCISKMMENGIYDIDRELFVTEYCVNHISVVERFEEYLNKYNEINGNLEAAKEYRDYRKATRGMFVGGGFGFEGAVKGMATAGAMNMASGLLHSVANAIGNKWDKSAAKYRMESIYNDPLTLCDLASSVWESAFNIHYAYIEVLENRNDIVIPKFSQDNIRKSQAIYSNIRRLELPFEQAQKPLCEMFALQPYEYEYYQYVILQYGDKDNQLQKIGEFFHINMDEMKMVLLREIISAAINFDNIDSDIDDVMGRLKDITEYFGISESISKPLRERIRASFFAYKFNKYTEKRTGLYLPSYKVKDNVLLKYREYRNSIRSLISEACSKGWNQNLSDGYLIGPEQIENMREEYKDYLLLFSVNSEKKNFVFKLSDTLLEYGRGRVIRVSQINEIAVKDKSLIINNKVWIPFSCDRLDEKQMEKLFKKIIEIIQKSDKSKITDLLGVKYNVTQEEQQIIDNVSTYVDNVEADMKRFVSAYNVFVPNDLEHTIVYYNICSKLELQTGKKFSETPVILFKNRVTSSLLDHAASDTEYNQTLFKVTSDEYAFFTAKNVVFTATGASVPIAKLGKLSIDEEDGSIYITDKGVKQVITNFMPEGSVKIKEFIQSLIKIYKGEQVKVKKSAAPTVSADAYMTEIYTKVMNYAKKRMNREEMEIVFSHVLLNCNNNEFDRVYEQFANKYEYVKGKEVLCMLIDDAKNPEFAVFVTKKEFFHIFEFGREKICCGFDLSNKSLTLDYVHRFELYINEDTHPYTREFCLNYFDKGSDEPETLIEVLKFKGQVNSCLNNIFAISNMVLDYICEKEKVKKKCNIPPLSVIDEINNYYQWNFGYGTAEKNLFVISKEKGTTPAYTMLVNAEKYYDIADRDVVLAYNDAILSPGKAGVIITHTYLYYNIVPDKGKIPIKDILEIRCKDGKVAEIVTNNGTHKLQYTNPGELALGALTTLISEVVFLLQERSHLIKDELEEEKVKKKAIADQRKQKGVFNYVQRQAVNEIKDEYKKRASVLKGTADFYFNDGTPEMEKKFNDLKEKFGIRYDNIEVPLIAVHSVGNERKEGFLLTNEKWYHMVSGTGTYRVGLRGIKWAGSEPSLTQVNEIILLKGQERNYRVCKVEDHQKEPFIEFLECIIESYDELSGTIDLSGTELKAKEKELTKLISGYEKKTVKELESILSKIEVEYPFDFAESAKKKIEAQIVVVKDRELVEEMEALCKNLNQMDLAQLDKLKQQLQRYRKQLAEPFITRVEDAVIDLMNKIKQELDELMQGYESLDLDEIKNLEAKIFKYPSECRKTYIEKLSSRKNELYIQKWDEKCKGLEHMGLKDVQSLINELQEDRCSSTVKEPIKERLIKRQDSIYLEQIDNIMNGYESMTIEELSDLSDALKDYPAPLTVDSNKKIKEEKRKLYLEKIEARSVNLDSMSMEEVLNLKKLLQNEGCEADIKKKFEKKYNDRLKQLYEELFEDWLLTAKEGDYLSAEKIREDISLYDAPQDIIEKYDAKAREIVKELYFDKYKEVYNFANNICLQRNLEICDVDYGKKAEKYDRVPTSYWEKPLLGHYAERLIGGSTYTFTPDRFYICTNEKTAFDVSTIAGFSVVKKLMSNDITLNTTTGLSVNISSKHGKNVEIVADTLNQILYQIRMLSMPQMQAAPQMQPMPQMQAAPQMQPMPQMQVAPQMQQKRFCSTCGGPLPEGARFCGKCGSAV